MKRAFEPFEKKVWLSSPTMHGSEIEYITEAYETNWMSTVGENINQVEQMTCEKTGCKYAVALSSGTAPAPESESCFRIPFPPLPL